MMSSCECKRELKISLLSGGDDPSYAIPLLKALAAEGIEVDFIGNDRMQTPDVLKIQGVNYLNLRGDQTESASIAKKIKRIAMYYVKLLRYAYSTESKLFHILWLNKFEYIDRTIINIYYKMVGKRLFFTAHNVNAGIRDNNDSFINRMTLKTMYILMDRIFVHTEAMKDQLINEFKIKKENITVIPFGINNYVQNTNITSSEAKERLGLDRSQRVVLFFGQIAPYKGLDLLISSLNVLLREKNWECKAIIAGKIKNNYEYYWEEISASINRQRLNSNVMILNGYIPDEEVELYFKAADVLILPYRSIYQTGVLFLAYNFGLPAIATDVGSLREDIVENKTGLVCRPDDPRELGNAIITYFESDLYKELEGNRKNIMKYAQEKYSWKRIGKIISDDYEQIIRKSSAK